MLTLVIAYLAGCAGPGGPAPSLTRATEIRSAAAPGITIGKSTKADVIALLGKTTAISFDSGYEVWVYHMTRDVPERRDPEKAEFVVLFTPSGVVSKTRIRPPTPSRS